MERADVMFALLAALGTKSSSSGGAGDQNSGNGNGDEKKGGKKKGKFRLAADVEQLIADDSAHYDENVASMGVPLLTLLTNGSPGFAAAGASAAARFREKASAAMLEPKCAQPDFVRVMVRTGAESKWKGAAHEWDMDVSPEVSIREVCKVLFNSVLELLNIVPECTCPDQSHPSVFQKVLESGWPCCCSDAELEEHPHRTHSEEDGKFPLKFIDDDSAYVRLLIPFNTFEKGAAFLPSIRGISTETLYCIPFMLHVSFVKGVRLNAPSDVTRKVIFCSFNDM